MPDQTPILALPVLVPNQAQPYVTHNEALRRLDILVQMSVLEFGAETPPALPEEGGLYALGAAPVAGWAGQAHKLAAWIDGAWLFIAPQDGWRAWDRDTGLLRVWDGADWARPPAELDNVDGVGIGTASDPVNRLAVKSDAVLFSHDGAGHQLKINKAGDADTASLLLQSDWTGHAEIGLAGDTDLAIKVSPDGSAWTEALRFDAASGEAFGAAVQSGPGDTAAGRIPKMGNDADFADLSVDQIVALADTQGGASAILRAVGTLANDGMAQDEYVDLVFNHKRGSDGATGTVARIRSIAEADQSSSWPTALAVHVRRFSSDFEAARFESTGTFRPGTDNSYKLGSASYRWSEVFAGTGTINTSDANTKEQITDLDATEKAVAIAARGLLRKFKFRDAVADKGADARWHFGVIAQDLAAAFEAEGLDPWTYGVLCRDEWWEVDVTVPAAFNDDGEEVKPERMERRVFDSAEEAPESATRVERYGVRYEELFAFILAGL